jgi:hypothetical protein
LELAAFVSLLLLSNLMSLILGEKKMGVSVFCLNQIGNVSGHFFNFCVVMLLNVLKSTFVFFGYKIDCNTFAAETSTTTDSERKVEKKEVEINCFIECGKFP